MGRSSVGNRGPLRDGGDARSSPHPSVIALGCLYGGDERGEGRLALESTRLTARHGCRDLSEVRSSDKGLTVLQREAQQELEQDKGEDYCLDWGSSQA